MGSCPTPAVGSSACRTCGDTGSGTKLAASSPYEEKSLLSANLAFSASSPQGPKSPGLQQGRRRRTHVVGDMEEERATALIQTMTGAAQLVRGCASTQKPPLLKNNPCFHWFFFCCVSFWAGLSHRCPNTSAGKESSGKGPGLQPGSLLAASLHQAIAWRTTLLSLWSA